MSAARVMTSREDLLARIRDIAGMGYPPVLVSVLQDIVEFADGKRWNENTGPTTRDKTHERDLVREMEKLATYLALHHSFELDACETLVDTAIRIIQKQALRETMNEDKITELENELVQFRSTVGRK